MRKAEEDWDIDSIDVPDDDTIFGLDDDFDRFVENRHEEIMDKLSSIEQRLAMLEKATKK